MNKEFLKKKIFLILSSLLIGSYIVIFSYLSVSRYLSFKANYYDLGIMDQTVYNTSQGRFLELTDPDSRENISRIAIHFDPILAIFAPLYRIHPSPIILLVGQSVILGLGGVAVLLIAKKLLKSRWLSLVCLFLYLNYYPLQLSNMFDFHAVTIATTALLFAFYFFVFSPLKKEIHNIYIGIFFLILTLLTKENTALTIMALCGYLFVTKKEKKIYFFLAISMAFVFISVVFFIIPFFAKSPAFAISYYDFHQPFSLLRWLFSLRSLNYILMLSLPFGLLSLLSPMQFMIIIPELFLNLLSASDNMRAVYYHYTALITPFLMISCIYGLKRFLALIHNDTFKKNTIIGIVLIAVSILTNVLSGYTNYSFIRITNRSLSNRIYYWQQILKNDQIKVSTTGSIAPFFTERRYFYDFFFDPAYQTLDLSKDEIEKNTHKYAAADYVIIYKKDIYPQDDLRDEFYNDLKANKDFHLVESNDDIEVYKKSI